MRTVTGLLLLGLLATGCAKIQEEWRGSDLKVCANETNEVATALAACDKLIAAGNPDSKALAHLHFLRAFQKQRNNDQPGALRDLDESIRLDPNDWIVFANRSNVLSNAGDQDRAFVDINRAIELDGRDFRLYGQRCWIRAVQARELDVALDDCTKALQGNPQDWNSFNSRGFAQFRMGRFKEAIADYDTAIAGDPSVASSYLIRGMAKRALADNAGADADLAEANSRDAGVAARYAGYGVVAE